VKKTGGVRRPTFLTHTVAYKLEEQWSEHLQSRYPAGACIRVARAVAIAFTDVYLAELNSMRRSSQTISQTRDAPPFNMNPRPIVLPAASRTWRTVRSVRLQRALVVCKPTRKLAANLLDSPDAIRNPKFRRPSPQWTTKHFSRGVSSAPN